MAGVSPEGHEPLTPVVLHILLSLAGGPSHGYAVMQQVEEESGLVMGPGTVYGSLQRLEDGGLVREAEVEGGGRRRRYYEITAEGLRALEREAVRLDRLSELLRWHGIVREGTSEAGP